MVSQSPPGSRPLPAAILSGGEPDIAAEDGRHLAERAETGLLRDDVQVQIRLAQQPPAALDVYAADLVGNSAAEMLAKPAFEGATAHRQFAKNVSDVQREVRPLANEARR